MKTKRADDWTSHLADSSLPSDDFTMTDGANGLLDGFSFENNYNEGVLDGARLPESKGLSGLPDGIITAENESVGYTDIELNDEVNGTNLDTMLSMDEGGEDISQEVQKAASLANLDWLDPTQTQDPERLPKELRPDQPPLNSVPELERAWGSNEPTTGISLVPAKDLNAIAYEESLKEGPQSGLPGTAKTAEEKQDAVLHAARRSHWGHDIRSILAELKRAVGDTPLGREAALEIKKDHGLAGKVFIRASVFPGLKNGRWVPELKKAAKTAKYVITDDQMVADRLAMQMVASVPWGAALREFTPRMHASGYKLASGNPKEVLRKAFLTGPVNPPVAETNFPEQHAVVATAKEAQKELDRVAAIQAPVFQAPEGKAFDQKLKVAMVRIAKLVKAGQLSQKEALHLKDLGDRGFRPEALLKAAADLLVAHRDTPDYDGAGALLSKEAELERAPKQVSAAIQETRLEEIRKKKAMVHVARLVQQKILTAADARDLVEGKTASEIEKEAANLVATSLDSSASQIDKVAEGFKAKEYQGTVQKLAVVERKAPVTKTSEFKGMIRWARQQMNEGMVGKDLDDLLKARFASPSLKEAEIQLKEIRAAHEGLAGHLYVDAAAYASTTGTEGCEQGGLKHRANSLKFVLEMPRCASCTQHDSENHCLVYNKRLAAQPPVEDVREYQKEAIRLADAHDSEITASMFDPNEFGLQNESFENVTVASELNQKQLGDVLFGGTELP